MEKTIQQILTPNYLERFKKAKNNHPQTLFGMDWKMLEKKRCVWCGNKLKLMMKQPKYYCSSPKHKKTFIVKKEVVI